MDWIYKGEVVDKIDLDKYVGFVYIITNLISGQRYIGKKFLTTKRRKPPLKGYKRKRIVIAESKWRSYYGSNDILKSDVKQFGEEHFEREILHLCKSKAAVSQWEVIEQFSREVLYLLDSCGERVYYNNNISGKFYPVDEIKESFEKGVFRNETESKEEKC